MTIITPAQEVTVHTSDTLITSDPLDQLVPPPRPWWLRLMVASAIVALVGTCSYLVGHGYLYPRPNCCGSGSGGGVMALAPDGKSVVVTTFFFNSSDATLVVRSGSAHLEGAHVLSMGVSAEHDGSLDLLAQNPFPVVVGGHGQANVVVRFVPDSCVDTGGGWGTVDLRLDVRNGWLPSIERTYRVPGSVVEANRGISILPPNSDPNWNSLRTPLAAACALLAGKP
jgi:hypothetical protein